MRRVKLAMILGVVACLGLSSRAARARTVEWPVTGGGYLTMTETDITIGCGGSQRFDPGRQWTAFSYSLDTVTNPSLMARLDDAETPCFPKRTYIVRLRGGCTIAFEPDAEAALICAGVPGYVGPKYLVVGVTYVPPGPSSFVQYSTSTSFGTTTSLTNSFSATTSVSVSVSAGAKIAGWLNGKLTVTGSTSETQSSSDSSSTTVSIQNLFTTRLGGTPNAFSPVNHDYDLIWLWLNPVMLFKVYPRPPSFPSVVTWNGYGYDATDQPAMDIWPIEVGYLNGHFGPLPFTDASVLARSWAVNQLYAQGQGPALTSADFANILRADPFANPGYSVTLSNTATPATTVDGRFTISGAGGGGTQSFIYRQPAPGGTPLTQTLTNTYGNTSTLGRSSSYQAQVGFGIDASMSASFFGVTFGSDIKFSRTLTHTHQSSSSVTSTTTQIDMLSVTGPPCGSSTPPCVPVYTGPPEFNVYQDNVFGTFMFNPVH
jgi:hypothetical protein